MHSVMIRKANRLSGTITLPGDKSISHRALLLGAIADGKTTIRGLSTAQDVMSTSSCLQALGVNIENKHGDAVVHGVGLSGLKKSRVFLYAGNSGTTMRLLSGILAGQPFSSVLDGDASLRRRPMNRVIEPLKLMGARIDASENGVAPFRVAGGGLHGITYKMPMASSQVKSAVLLAGLYAEGETVVVEPAPTRNHTEIMLRAMGVSVENGNGSITIKPQAVSACELLDVPGDISSAVFFLAAGLLVPGSEVKMLGVGLNPTRAHVLKALEGMGAIVTVENRETHAGEERGDLRVKTSELRSFEISGRDVPLVIDEIPMLAMLATQAKGVSKIRDAKELRVKESDRIEAIAVNLQKMGAQVKAYDDGMDITGPVALKGTSIQTFGDHRIAMAFAIAGLIAKGETVIDDAGSAAVSFPEFFDTLEALQR